MTIEHLIFFWAGTLFMVICRALDDERDWNFTTFLLETLACTSLLMLAEFAVRCLP